MKRLSFLIKPASAACNLRCRYCFYADVSEHRTCANFGLMTRKTAHAIIDAAFREADDADITFAFQGGEPSLAGLNFFEDFCSYAQEQRTRQHLHYLIQSNGTLLNQKWAAFLSRENFLVGLSLDGFPELHDELRPDARGEGTFAQVMQSAELLRSHKVKFNILTVLTSQLSQHPRELYDFYRSQNFEYIQLIPCLPSLDDPDGAHDPFALQPEQFASFYQVFFDCWLAGLKEGYQLGVTLFEDLIPLFRGIAPQQCGMLGSCAPQFVIEATGDVYPCDFYVLDQWKLGNINEDSLQTLAQTARLEAFLNEPRRPCDRCDDCAFERICHRNCKRLNASYYRQDYCGYREFLEARGAQMYALAQRLF